MLVSDLKSVLESQNERSVDTRLGDLMVAGDASHITLLPTEEEFVFDEQAGARVLRLPRHQQELSGQVPARSEGYNINYWLQAKADVPTVIQAVGDNVINMHKPGLVILPLPRVAEIITNTFEPDNEIVNLIRDDRKFHIDIKTDHHVEVRPDTRIEGRHEVGDITHGGVRILANPIEVEAPKVMTYLHRLWCTNGCTSPEREGTIRLKGNTVDEVLDEMEQACADGDG